MKIRYMEIRKHKKIVFRAPNNNFFGPRKILFVTRKKEWVPRKYFCAHQKNNYWAAEKYFLGPRVILFKPQK